MAYVVNQIQVRFAQVVARLMKLVGRVKKVIRLPKALLYAVKLVNALTQIGP